MSFVAQFFLSALFCSVPGAIISKICWYLFAQPCLQVDKSKTSGCVDSCLASCACLATSCGMAIVCAWSTVFFIIGLVFWLTPGANFANWAYGVGQFWFIWVLQALAFDFQPSATVSRVLGGLVRKVTCGVFRLGKWHKERDEVLAIIREKIALRGSGQFTSPGSPREGEGEAAGEKGGDLEDGLGPAPRAAEGQAMEGRGEAMASSLTEPTGERPSSPERVQESPLVAKAEPVPEPAPEKKRKSGGFGITIANMKF